MSIQKEYHITKYFEQGVTLYRIDFQTYNVNEFDIITEQVNKFMKERIPGSEDITYCKWIKITEPGTYPTEDCPSEYYRCSNCKCDSPWYTPFCPECGEPMEIPVVFQSIVVNKPNVYSKVDCRNIPVKECYEEKLQEHFKNIFGRPFEKGLDRIIEGEEVN